MDWGYNTVLTAGTLEFKSNISRGGISGSETHLDRVTATMAPVTSESGTDTTPAVTTTTGSGITPPEPDVLPGDINEDGEVSVDDAQLTLKAYTKRIAGKDSTWEDILGKKPLPPSGSRRFCMKLTGIFRTVKQNR